VTSSNAIDANSSIRFGIRSYIAFVLTPQAPTIEWLTQLDNWTRNSPGFFDGRPVVLDLSAVKLSPIGIRHLLSELAERGVRIIGLEAADDVELGPSLPPRLLGGRPVHNKQGAPDDASNHKQTATALEQQTVTASEEPTVTASEEPTSLLIEALRSGQTVVFPNGDVTVLGSVASGSEIVAGGSIHVYGTLRGRAMAGSQGNTRARIFCAKNEAELLAINGYYRTADELDGIRSQPAQTWLENGVLIVAPME
jgi:septum site-determining protein MinC